MTARPASLFDVIEQRLAARRGASGEITPLEVMLGTMRMRRRKGRSREADELAAEAMPYVLGEVLVRGAPIRFEKIEEKINGED